MAGYEKGRPIKWVNAKVQEKVFIGKPGVEFEISDKWSKKEKKLGTLIVSVGGLRWRSHKGRFTHKNWDAVKTWFGPES